MTAVLRIRNPKLVWFLGMLVFGFTSAFMIFQCYRAFDSKNWLETEGKIVAYYQNPDYEFTANGKAYVGNKISLNEFVSHSAEWAQVEKNVAKYPLGATVKVHYNPNNPEIAVLEKRFNRQHYWTTLYLLGAFVVCCVGRLLCSRSCS